MDYPPPPDQPASPAYPPPPDQPAPPAYPPPPGQPAPPAYPPPPGQPAPPAYPLPAGNVQPVVPPVPYQPAPHPGFQPAPPPPPYGQPAPGPWRLPKSKTTAVLLAIFLGFVTWMYTYERDAWKFWTALAVTVGDGFLSIVTFGVWLFVAIPVAVVIWVWGIVDAAAKPQRFYDFFPAA